MAIKLAAGISVGLVYKYYYETGDTFGFFQDAVILTSTAKNDIFGFLGFLWNSESPELLHRLVFTEPRSLFFVKILSLINLLTHDNYWVSSLYFSLVSFLGAWMLTKRVCQLLPDARIAAIVSFLLLPSVVFWSSGIVKESLASAALFYLSSVFISIWMGRKLKYSDGLMSLFSIWMLWKIKYYYLAVFLPVVVAVLLSRYLIRILKVRSFVSECFIWLMVFTVPLFLVTFFHPNFYLDRLAQVIISNNQAFTSISETRDLIHYHDLRPEVASILVNTPWALFSGLFRPFVTEVSTLFKFLISMENLLLFMLGVTAFSSLKHIAESENHLITFALIVYVILLCVFLALSTPNFGTLVRYRVAYYPFFTFLVMYRNPVVTWFFRFR